HCHEGRIVDRSYKRFVVHYVAHHQRPAFIHRASGLIVRDEVSSLLTKIHTCFLPHRLQQRIYKRFGRRVPCVPLHEFTTSHKRVRKRSLVRFQIRTAHHLAAIGGELTVGHLPTKHSAI